MTIALSDIAGAPPGFRVAPTGAYVWSVPGALADTVKFAVCAGLFEEIYLGGALSTEGPTISALTSDYLPPPAYTARPWSNRLYRNDGGFFSEVTSIAFAVNPDSVNSKAAAWADYDNDGWIDLYVANGGTIETGNQANFLYRNLGNGTFAEVAAAEGVVGSPRGMSDGASFGDVNLDGAMDLYVVHGAESPPYGVGPRELFLNTPNANHWIGVHLLGKASNGAGIGARVRVITAAGKQYRRRLGESDNGFSETPSLHFGLGASSTVDTLTIEWPSGQVDTYSDVAGDRRWTAIEGAGILDPSVTSFSILTSDVVDSLLSGSTGSVPFEVENSGALALHSILAFEDSAGNPITWLSTNDDSLSIFPGKTVSRDLVLDTSNLSLGNHEGRVIVTGNGASDTLFVTLTNVESPVDASTWELPSVLALSIPRPNPAREAVTFTQALPTAADIDLTVYDAGGDLFDRWPPTGDRPASIRSPGT